MPTMVFEAADDDDEAAAAGGGGADMIENHFKILSINFNTIKTPGSLKALISYFINVKTLYLFHILLIWKLCIYVSLFLKVNFEFWINKKI